jgi:Carboxypeptidase regulatory-like domain
MAVLCLIAVTCAIVSVAACRRGVPVIDPGEPPPTTDGTISGTVRGPEGTSSIADREVTVTNLDTGEKQSAKTNDAGGFTFKVKPGKYRVEVSVIAGESILKQPGVMHINRSDVDAHADFIIGSAKGLPSRRPAGHSDASLGPPIA